MLRSCALAALPKPRPAPSAAPPAAAFLQAWQARLDLVLRPWVWSAAHFLQVCLRRPGEVPNVGALEQHASRLLHVALLGGSDLASGTLGHEFVEAARRGELSWDQFAGLVGSLPALHELLETGGDLGMRDRDEAARLLAEATPWLSPQLPWAAAMFCKHASRLARSLSLCGPFVCARSGPCSIQDTRPQGASFGFAHGSFHE